MQQTLVRGKNSCFHLIQDWKQDGNHAFVNNKSEVSSVFTLGIFAVDPITNVFNVPINVFFLSS